MPSARIFVGLDYQVTEGDILDKFEQWGKVKEVFIPKDFRGRCKGYAFIEFENSQDAAGAIEAADRTAMFGRTIRLEPATGSRKAPGDRNGADRPVRSMRGPPDGEGRAREFSTLRPTLSGFMAVKKPVQLTQINPIVGRRMFGLAASMVLKRRFI